jgi:hypothetical protein
LLCVRSAKMDRPRAGEPVTKVAGAEPERGLERDSAHSRVGVFHVARERVARTSVVVEALEGKESPWEMRGLRCFHRQRGLAGSVYGAKPWSGGHV